jgi:hypothetical protein
MGESCSLLQHRMIFKAIYFRGGGITNHGLCHTCRGTCPAPDRSFGSLHIGPASSHQVQAGDSPRTIPARIYLSPILLAWFISAIGKRPIVLSVWVARMANIIPTAIVIIMMALAVQPLYSRPIFELVFRWLSH